MASWYHKYFPTIRYIKSSILPELNKYKNIDGVRSLYLWGELAQNINNNNTRIKNIDLLIKTSFYSEDLISVDDNVINCNLNKEELENQGYDPRTVNFSNNIRNLERKYINLWVISSDKRLVHWGPIADRDKDQKEIVKEAEEFANNNTKVNKENLIKISAKQRDYWFSSYNNYLNKYFEGMPSGWYKIKDIKVKEIYKNVIKI